MMIFLTIRKEKNPSFKGGDLFLKANIPHNTNWQELLNQCKV